MQNFWFSESFLFYCEGQMCIFSSINLPMLLYLIQEQYILLLPRKLYQISKYVPIAI